IKFSLAALLFVPLALALEASQPLPEQELSDGSVAAGLVTSEAPKANALNAAASCPIDYPYMCPNGLCCPYNICCSRECCAPEATYCDNGYCWR
ncbi:hypothetical protein C8A00DRAFT_13944, partial [Chaetomidium leptoderma]